MYGKHADEPTNEKWRGVTMRCRTKIRDRREKKGEEGDIENKIQPR